jgi:hypothetical protein
MYEIWEERLVARDGANEQEQSHNAVVGGDRGGRWLRLRILARGMLRVECEPPNVVVKLSELVAAISDLKRLAGMDDELPLDVAEARERAAEIVERTCEALGDDDPYRATLATDLRTVVLALLASPTT